jgi:hypothetical protein
LAQQISEPGYPHEDTEMIYTVEMNFKNEGALELSQVSAQTAKDAKRRALIKARELGYRAGAGKITVRRHS